MTGQPHVVGLDVGGAHVKAANTVGVAISRPFAVWREPERLTEVLREVLASFDSFDLVALVTTAELADCFRTKAEGVKAVVDATSAAAGSFAARVVVWQTGAEFVTPSVARSIPMLVAAANWHAQATWLGRLVPSDKALLIDVGSTTTDLVPISDGVPDPRGLTDVERLVVGELVYSGVGRTPVFHVCREVPFRGRQCPLAPELFATMLDVYLVTGDVPESDDGAATANGRPATVEFARERLARALCCDASELSEAEIVASAEHLAAVHCRRLSNAIKRVARECGPFANVLVSGSGSFLVDRALDGMRELNATSTRMTLNEIFDASTATAACARAVAELAMEREAHLLADVEA